MSLERMLNITSLILNTMSGSLIEKPRSVLIWLTTIRIDEAIVNASIIEFDKKLVKNPPFIAVNSIFKISFV